MAVSSNSQGAADGHPLLLVFVPSLFLADWNVDIGQSCILDHANERDSLGIVE